MSPKELTYIEDALSHEKFLKTQCHEADEALYWAKTRGKNRDCCYQTDQTDPDQCSRP